MGQALGDIATLHAYDLPCHGKSGDWDGRGVMHDTATDMALAVLDDMGDRPVDILGHSFGATVALRLAIEHPHRVRSVAMFEPVFFAAAMADDPGFADRYGRDTAPFDAALDAGDTVGAARAFNAVWGDATPWDDIPEATRDYMAARIGFVRASTPFLVADSAGLLDGNRFGAADMPALLLRGATSPWAGSVNAAIARRLPDVRDVAVEGCGHMGPITDPQLVGKVMRDFLDAGQVGSSMM